MEERTLKRIALLCSLIGIIILFFVSSAIGPQLVKIGKITIEDLGVEVLVCGLVEGKKISNNHTFLDIRDETGTITFIIFNSSLKHFTGNTTNPQSIGRGDMLCASGVVDEWPKGSGELELVYRKGLFEKI